MKKVKSIIAIVLVLGILFSLPGFADTQDTLKDIFVTRGEWNKWINVDGTSDSGGAPIGMSAYLSSLEVAKQQSIQDEVEYQVWKRDLLPASKSELISESVMNGWKERRKKEIINHTIVWKGALQASKWMARIPDYRYMNQVNLPGTHDSGMAFAYDVVSPILPQDLVKALAITQKLTLEEQLNSGVRFFDIRVAEDTSRPNIPFIAHGDSSYMVYAATSSTATDRMTLNYVLDLMEDWVEAHSSEFLVLSIKEEGPTWSSGFLSTVNSLLGSSSYTRIVRDGTIKSVAQARGKIFIATRKNGVNGLDFKGIADNNECTKTVDGVDFAVSDYYNCSIENKKAHITAAFSARDTIGIERQAKGDKGTLIFTSGYYFNLSALLSSTTPEVMANEIHPLVKSYPFKQEKNYGWVLFDFIDGELCRKIWETN